MIHKTFKILEALAFKKVKTISEISISTSIPKSTVHRILQALAEEEVVTMKPQQGYMLTPKIISLGLNGIAEKEIIDIAVPVMRSIAEKTKETISLNVLSGHERICIYRVEGDHPITRNIKIGHKGPLFRGSVGKVFAAGLSQSERMEILNKYIDQGIIAREETEALLAEIHKVKELGYAVSISERVENSASIAVPIKDIAGYVQATLSISTLSERLHEENIKRYQKLLLESAQKISAAQGAFEH